MKLFVSIVFAVIIATAAQAKPVYTSQQGGSQAVLVVSDEELVELFNTCHKSIDQTTPEQNGVEYYKILDTGDHVIISRTEYIREASIVCTRNKLTKYYIKVR